MELISWNEWQRDLKRQEHGEKTNAIGIMYKKIMREVIADERAIVGADVVDYRAESKGELNRWLKKIGNVKPIIKILNRFDLTVHELKIKKIGEGVRTVKMVLAVKTKDDGYFGGWDVLNYEHERLKEEWKVQKARNKNI